MLHRNPHEAQALKLSRFIFTIEAPAYWLLQENWPPTFIDRSIRVADLIESGLVMYEYRPPDALRSVEWHPSADNSPISPKGRRSPGSLDSN